MKEPTRISTDDVTLSTGEVRTEADFEKMALDAEAMEFDLEDLGRNALRRSGRPSLGGDGPSDVVKVRLDETTRTALIERAAHEHRTPSAVARDAIKAWLEAS
jgi:hypothetical protein